MVNSAPVMYRLASEPRRMTAPLRSDGSPMRPIGIRLSHSSRSCVLASRMTLVRLVRVYPGLDVSFASWEL